MKSKRFLKSLTALIDSASDDWDRSKHLSRQDIATYLRDQAEELWLLPPDPVTNVEMAEVLEEAGKTFDDYAQQHIAKSPPQFSKAQRNINMAEKCYSAIGMAYAAPMMPTEASFALWENQVRSESASTAPLTPVESDSAVLAPETAPKAAKGLLRTIYDFSENESPLKGVDVHLDLRPALDAMVELRLVTRDDVTDLLGITTEGRLALDIRPQGSIDLPVEVAEVTGNIAESELVARYCDSKVAAIDRAIAMREVPIHEQSMLWTEAYQYVALAFKATADEFRQGLHLPSLHLDGRVIPYNEDRGTGIQHRIEIGRFFDDVYQRNVKAGWWTDIETGKPKKRSVGELFMRMVTELAEAYQAYVMREPDDKLPKYPGVGVEIGDLLIRVADFAGALNAGNIVYNVDAIINPGDEMFQQVVEIARGYEAIRKTPAAIGMAETGDYMPAMDVAEMVDAKLAFNATRKDHSIEERLKADGKRT